MLNVRQALVKFFAKVKSKHINYNNGFLSLIDFFYLAHSF